MKKLGLAAMAMAMAMAMAGCGGDDDDGPAVDGGTVVDGAMTMLDGAMTTVDGATTTDGAVGACTPLPTAALPLTIEGDTTGQPVWTIPSMPTGATCPFTMFRTLATYKNVPRVAHVFCNTGTTAKSITLVMEGMTIGRSLTDPMLFIYPGAPPVANELQCATFGDDISPTDDDAQITNFSVAAGATITVYATSLQNDFAGTYRLTISAQ